MPVSMALRVARLWQWGDRMAAKSPEMDCKEQIMKTIDVLIHVNESTEAALAAGVR
jgi:hypothetical protein